MKENKYDNQAFFEKYSQMTRSTQGLAGAGEWQALEKILPDFTEKEVLDLGCGYGWHAIEAVERGAASVIGVDLSEKMLAVAKEQTRSEKVTYRREAMEAIDYPAETFDIVLSSLAFHYVADYERLIQKIHQMLKPKGILIFTVEHPIFTAEGCQDWCYDEKGKIRHFPVDNYALEGARHVRFLGEEMTKYHRTLTTYVNTLLQNGYQLNHLVEPEPASHLLTYPGMKDELRRPMMLILSATKQ
ncbi:class I SAM-dependent methyltransferase [Enterococcus sp. LJL98]